MAIEQMNISLSPQMARFIRGKVKNGEYANMRESIRRGVRQGIKDIEEGRYEEYNADGLRNVAKELVASSAKKPAGRSTVNEFPLQTCALR